MIKTYTSKETQTEYAFHLSMKAKAKLDGFRKSVLEDSRALEQFATKSEELANALMRMNEINLNTESKTATPEELAEAKQLAEVLGKVAVYAADPFAVSHVVLANTKAHKGISSEDFEELVEEMELDLGVEETYEFFCEVRNMVFTLLDEIAMKEAKNLDQQLSLIRLKNKSNGKKKT